MRHLQLFRSVSVSWFTAAALAGWAGCGFNSGAPGNNGKIDASTGQGGDAIGPPDGFDGTCYGPAGWQACFTSTSPPSGTMTLPGLIDTDGGTSCLNVQPIGWAAPQPAACFVVGDTITVPGGGTKVIGSKPLVLVAKTSITVAGVLDVASHKGDVGTQPSECQAFGQTPNGPSAGVGGGGGAGGSFRTQAGNGGNGDNATQNGQSAPADAMAAPNHLRGGCPAQVGGASAAGDAGRVGFGGGSVYLVSGGEIILQKSINASGAGGEGGTNKNNAGGSGGGSGGMIVLYAATITVTVPPLPAPAPVLMANGGGGGGGSQGARGGDGSDPSLTGALFPAGGGGLTGGKGYSVMNPTDVDGSNGSQTGSGGGGGGGGGAGYIRSNKPLPGAIVSPMVDLLP